MTFHSILYTRAPARAKREASEAPDFFADLNLDQIVDAITAGKQEYDLKSFFYSPLHDVETIEYRHEIMRDLENQAVFEYVKAFAKKMRFMREHVARTEKAYYKYEKERWFLEVVGIYCDAVQSLAHNLSVVDVQSRGLLAFREYLVDYASSDRFAALLRETEERKADLATVHYCLLIKGNSITVRKYESEPDYSTEVEETFERFKLGAVKDYRVNIPERIMNHVEANVLDLVARLYPEIFSALDEYCVRNAGYLDKTIGAFDREIQFYIAYLDHIAMFKRKGLQFCYPRVSSTSKEVYSYEGFDLALAYKLFYEDSPVVCNDFYLQDKERIIVVTGPNQGGKTTFARTFGQLHYLASIGCPVPGREAQLFLFDRLFTHFEKEEDIQNLQGKLQDDLVRLHDILHRATANSIIIMNEIFTSTTLADAIFLGEKVMERIVDLDVLCVCVTFVDELASLSEKTVSMVSTVVPDNPTLRTFKIVRRPADGLHTRYQLPKSIMLHTIVSRSA